MLLHKLASSSLIFKVFVADKLSNYAQRLDLKLPLTNTSLILLLNMNNKIGLTFLSRNKEDFLYKQNQPHY